MPSERGEESWLDRTWLRSQGLGVVCGLSTVALLAVGSFVLVRTDDGASAGVHMDDLRAFFRPLSPTHAWLYLLVVVFGLYALNTLLATWHSVSRKIAAGVRTPSAYGPPVIHVGFLLALLAHLAGGLYGAEISPILLAGEAQPLGDGRRARVVDIESETLPDGMPKKVRAHLEVTRPGGGVERAVVGYNEPLSEGFGASVFLLVEAGRVATAQLRVGSESCNVPVRSSCQLGGRRLELLGVSDPAPGGARVAMLRVTAPDGGVVEHRRLVAGASAPLRDGASIFLDGFADEPAVLVRGRKAPGNPIALASAVMLAIGLGLMARRLVPRD
jgi:hypothetical protein